MICLIKKILVAGLFIAIQIVPAAYGAIKSDIEIFRSEIETLCKNAINGDAEAQYELGLWYCMIDVDNNQIDTFEWFSKSANQGFAEAQYFFGMCYLEEFGVDVNPNKASELFSKAADQDHANAQFYICQKRNRLSDFLKEAAHHTDTKGCAVPDTQPTDPSIEKQQTQVPDEPDYEAHSKRNILSDLLAQAAKCSTTTKDTPTLTTAKSEYNPQDHTGIAEQIKDRTQQLILQKLEQSHR